MIITSEEMSKLIIKFGLESNIYIGEGFHSRKWAFPHFFCDVGVLNFWVLVGV
jgi:hypothetical protein